MLDLACLLWPIQNSSYTQFTQSWAFVLCKVLPSGMMFFLKGGIICWTFALQIVRTDRAQQWKIKLFASFNHLILLFDFIYSVKFLALNVWQNYRYIW